MSLNVSKSSGYLPLNKTYSDFRKTTKTTVLTVMHVFSMFVKLQNLISKGYSGYA